MRQDADYTEEDKNKKIDETEFYIDGNTVRRRERMGAPDDRERKAKKKSAHTGKKAGKQISTGYVVFLAAMCVAVIFSCVKYLSLKTELIKQRNLYTASSLEYNQIKAENDAYYSEITALVDLDEIRRKAIEDMGMHFPSPDQIIYYDPGDSSFVRQYQKVPEE